LYFAENPNDEFSYYTGWEISNALINTYQTSSTMITSPSVTSDSLTGFCTVQEWDGSQFSTATIYITDADFENSPSRIGAPVDMQGFGEDNAYYNINTGYLYFDAFDLSDPLSKQDIYAAVSLGSGTFNTPVELSGGINTVDVETQPFVHEQSSTLYFASDRDRDEFQLALYKASVFGDSANSVELVALGMLGLANPSISEDEEWMCFSYAREEQYGANADIALCRRLE
jgi:hypothetical protein